MLAERAAILEHFLPIKPKEILRKMAQAPRPIEDCRWANPVKIDFDLENIDFPSFKGIIPPTDPHHQRFMTELAASLQRQVIRGEHHILPAVSQTEFQRRHQIYPLPNLPDEKTNMIIGFYDEGSNFGKINLKAMLPDKDIEIKTPLVLAAGEKYFGNRLAALNKNYTVVVTIDEDIAKMPKREAENITRMLMARLGALKVIMIYPKKENSREVKYYALGTMEGGLAVEYAEKPGAIDRIRDRLVTHACAKESGKFVAKDNVVSKEDWEKTMVPEYIAAASRQLGRWGYIDDPFSIDSVANRERVRLIKLIMAWSQQSESAIAAHDPDLIVPEQYRMGNLTGVIISSKSGRFLEINKKFLGKRHTIPVAIIPRADYHPKPGEPLSLDGFDKYALGIEGEDIQKVGGPSIEFDEMSAAMMSSGFVRVSRQMRGRQRGFRLDPNGDILLPRVRGFIHIHQGLEQIISKIIPYYELPRKYWKTAKELTEYVPANFKDYPYPVGCGKNIMFATTVDAVARSKAVHYRDNDPQYKLPPGVQVVFFDATDHGTNALLLTEPVPGTNWIPEDPFYAVLPIVDKSSGGVIFTDDLVQV